MSYIDLNKPTHEEDLWEDRFEIGETPKKKKYGKKSILRNTINNLKIKTPVYRREWLSWWKNITISMTFPKS